jgi:hypothetical protein
MFRMKIEQQLNLNDRTLILGIPEFDVIPQRLRIGNSDFTVIGISVGTKPPYMSLEIEKTTKNLISAEAHSKSIT